MASRRKSSTPGPAPNEGTLHEAALAALGSRLRRAVFAWHFGDLNLLLSGNLRPESRLLFRRTVIQRIGALAGELV